MGDPTAASSIGQMYMKGMGVESNIATAMKFCQQAADHGLYSAMFMIAQYGVHIPEICLEGRKWALKLIDDGWEPPNPDHLGPWFEICNYYGIHIQLPHF
mmetsp:Transcript_16184/g.18496  ORF Transcript_16184/g.18496 Transcript_16184/m.18496 type:complete len:100 (+) Transcript_16184:3-302(+)